MARIRSNISYSDTRAELADAKARRRGASEDEFWDEDELVDYRPARKSKKKKKAGCAGNDGKNHVYVWISTDEFYMLKGYSADYFIFSRYQYKVCCGCLKRAPRRSFRVAP